MTRLKPTDFIQSVLIKELGIMIEKHPYISFMVMGIGIEFLGKCIDKSVDDFQQSGNSSANFKNAIEEIPSLKKYETYLATHDLYRSFRCGLVHAISPDLKITLSSKNEQGHLIMTNGRLNLKVEDFYDDFKVACEFVKDAYYPDNDKMNRDFLEVPGFGFNEGTNIPTGITQSISIASGATRNSKL